jgi:hypothetical protein
MAGKFGTVNMSVFATLKLKRMAKLGFVQQKIVQHVDNGLRNALIVNTFPQ